MKRAGITAEELNEEWIGDEHHGSFHHQNDDDDRW